MNLGAIALPKGGTLHRNERKRHVSASLVAVVAIVVGIAVQFCMALVVGIAAVTRGHRAVATVDVLRADVRASAIDSVVAHVDAVIAFVAMVGAVAVGVGVLQVVVAALGMCVAALLGAGVGGADRGA